MTITTEFREYKYPLPLSNAQMWSSPYDTPTDTAWLRTGTVTARRVPQKDAYQVRVRNQVVTLDGWAVSKAAAECGSLLWALSGLAHIAARGRR